MNSGWHAHACSDRRVHAHARSDRRAHAHDAYPYACSDRRMYDVCTRVAQ